MDEPVMRYAGLDITLTEQRSRDVALIVESSIKKGRSFWLSIPVDSPLGAVAIWIGDHGLPIAISTPGAEASNTAAQLFHEAVERAASRPAGSKAILPD